MQDWSGRRSELEGGLRGCDSLQQNCPVEAALDAVSEVGPQPGGSSGQRWLVYKLLVTLEAQLSLSWSTGLL